MQDLDDGTIHVTSGRLRHGIMMPVLILGLLLSVLSQAAMTDELTDANSMVIFSRAKPTGALIPSNCISDMGNDTCVDGDGLRGAAWITVSTDGQSAYVASFDSSALAVFARDPTTGLLTQFVGVAGCIAQLGDGVSCAAANGILGAVSVAVTPDNKNLYVAARDGNTVAAFARDITTGTLRQLSGTAGCIAAAGNGVTCANARALLGPRGIVISPDGMNVYVASRDSSAVAIFSRDTTTGVLTQLIGAAGCVSNDGSGGICSHGKALAGVRGIAVSPDSKYVYVASQTANAVAVFARDKITGVLTQLSGIAGCIAENGDGVTCAYGRGLLAPIHVDVSPDGKHVYVASRDSHSVAIFARNTKTGALTQLRGTAGCIAENGDDVTCAGGRGLNEAVYVAVSPDGKNVYVASQVSDAVAEFARNTKTGALVQLAGLTGCVSQDGALESCTDGNGLDGTVALTVSPDSKYVYAVAFNSNAVSIFNRN
jgi:DNA-binding beta-propeller fold protein YncE